MPLSSRALDRRTDVFVFLRIGQMSQLDSAFELQPNPATICSSAPTEALVCSESAAAAIAVLRLAQTPPMRRVATADATQVCGRRKHFGSRLLLLANASSFLKFMPTFFSQKTFALICRYADHRATRRLSRSAPTRLAAKNDFCLKSARNER